MAKAIKKVVPNTAKEITVTAKYLKDHPELAGQGIEVGDVVEEQEVNEAPKEEGGQPIAQETLKDGKEIVWYRVQYEDQATGLSERIFSKADHGKRVHSSVAITKQKFNGVVLETKTQDDLDNE